MGIVKAKGVPLNLGGDGHADSPGHSAKYGSYSVLDCHSNKLLDMQLVQVSSEHYIDFHFKVFTNNILLKVNKINFPCNIMVSYQNTYSLQFYLGK